jgi:hypothetical protein
LTQSDYERFREFIDRLKYEILTLDDYELLFTELGGEEVIKYKTKTEWVMYTMCHNEYPFEGSPKLYFYLDDYRLRCYTKCSHSMDIIELVNKRFKLLGKQKSILGCVKWICNTCGIPFEFKDEKEDKKDTDVYNWKSKLMKYVNKKADPDFELIPIEESRLNYFQKIYHDSWIENNISLVTMVKYGIRYYSYHDSIVIPCYDDTGRLVGIRERFLNPNSEIKYKPIRMLNGTVYKFPTNLVLFGYNLNKNAIKKYRKCVLFEAEKSTMQCDTYFEEDNFSISLFGKAMSEEKRNLIISLNVIEVVIAFDFDYEEVGYYNEEGEYIFTEEFENFKKNIYRAAEFFRGFCKVTALISYKGHKIHDSPSDNGKENYLSLYNEREELYEN